MIAGSILLLAGRKLFWLFVAIAGFYVGFEVTRVVVTDGPEWAVWAIVVLSSMVRAALVVSSLGLGNPGGLLAYAGLMAVGIIVQAQLMRGPHRHDR